MYCINTIQAINNHAVLKHKAETKTDVVELANGTYAVATVDRNDERVSGLLTGKRADAFRRKLSDHDGREAYVLHKRRCVLEALGK